MTNIVASLALSLLASSPSIGGPPPPPEGYIWVRDERFSDEFNGDKLDTNKWFDHHPHWKGRPPAKFMPYTVSVKDGMMQIKSGVLSQPDGKFTIACGAVVSKSAEAHYGYYEVRMKASKISMSSTFWLTDRPQGDAWPRTKQELDINEAVGAGKKHPSRKNFMKSNTHYVYSPGPGERIDKSVNGDTEISPPAGDVFHVYGAWWVDANTIKFYHNGEHKFTIHPSTEYSETPFDRPMYLNMVTETYDWETPPTPDELNDDSINTTYYDWVRCHVLVKE
ncbi:family 16 glycosylhydrolase [Candidatus Poribacteria bacterium]